LIRLLRNRCAVCVQPFLLPSFSSEWRPPAYSCPGSESLAGSLQDKKTRPSHNGTDALVRGATQFRQACLGNRISLMKHQGESQPHSSGTGRLHRSIPQLCNGSSRFGYSAPAPFASRLGGPFCVVVAGRLLTERLLSEPPYGAYSSSSLPLGIGRYYMQDCPPVKACDLLSRGAGRRRMGAVTGRPGRTE
jgi:hypothetical protein